MDDATHDQGMAMATAALVISMHLAEIMTAQGLVSSAKVAEIYDGVSESVAAGGATLVASIDANFAPVFAGMRTEAMRWEALRLAGG